MSGSNSKAHRLQSSSDLETLPEATRAGFVAMAMEKNRYATPYVDEARALHHQAAKAQNPVNLLQMDNIKAALLTAAGISDKAQKHLTPADKNQSIEGLIKDFLTPAGNNFVEELVFRFLLFRGDALGGTMRNLAGMLAQRKFTRTMLAILRNAGTSFMWKDTRSRQWFKQTDNDVDLDLSLCGLHWKNENKEDRTLMYNVTPPLVNNNVDIRLLDCSPEQAKLRKLPPDTYLALGELKGGIDPAGADEHWKTARTALSRIREAFAEAQAKPHLFFIGAAIEKRMAEEIWLDLEAGRLSNAANLTKDEQLTDIAEWLYKL
ncbi:MAG: type II restriction endonuclease [Chloroflexus sp.]|nr:type II restriction endonuclease [Chloroflexus sp.]